MKTSCKRIPDAPNGKPSKLFSDIQSHVHNRDITKRIWGFTQTDLFKSEFSDLAVDENGEVTYDEVARVLNLDSIFTESEKEVNEAIRSGIITPDGDPKSYSKAEVALSKAKEFNDTAKHKIVVVREVDGKYKTFLEDNTAMALADADRNEIRRNLNKALLSLLQTKLGFNVDFADDIGYNGVFDPIMAEENAYNLKTLIRVAKNEAGLEALPEEVSHLIIAGLKDHPLKQRLDAVFTDQVVEHILGDKYEYYVKKYKDGNMLISDRLREEAEGQMLASMLLGESQTAVVASYFREALTDDNRNLLLDSTKPFIQQAKNIANALGIKILAQENQSGIYQGNSELSYKFHLKEKDNKKVDLFVSLLSDLGYEYQDAGIAAKYVEAKNSNAIELVAKIPQNATIADVKKVLKEHGIEGASINQKDKTLTITAFSEEEQQDYYNKLKGTEYEPTEFRYQDSRYLDNRSRQETYRSWLEGRQESNRDDLRDAVEKALSIAEAASKFQGEGQEQQRLEASKNAAANWDKTHSRSAVAKTIHGGAKTLLSRLWNYVKDKVSKNLSEDDINNAMIEAEHALRPIADLVNSGEIHKILSREQILKHEKMYDLSAKTERLAEMAEDGEVLLSKKLSILQNTQTEEDTVRLQNDIRTVRNALNKQHYAAACFHTLSTISKDVKELMKDAEKAGSIYSGATDLNLISAQAGLVGRMSTAIAAYTKYLTTMTQIPALIKRGQIEMDEAWVPMLTQLATESLSCLNDLQEDINSLRKAVLESFVSLYYGENGKKPENFVEQGDIKWQSVQMILSKTQDTSWWDTSLFSAGDSRNPLINTIHKIIVTQQSKRNNIINKFCAKMQEEDKKLRDAGYENSFIYELDKDGIPTQYYKSPYDFVKFDEAYKTYADLINNNDDLEVYEKRRLMDKWESENLEEVEVGEPDVHGHRRTEWMPKKEIYGNPDFQKGWSKAQIDYYDAVIKMKAEMDSYLPVAQQHLYLAPQVRKSVSQMFDKGGRGAAGNFWNKFVKDISVITDSDEYSETGMEKKTRTVLLDFSGKQIKRVPTYYTKPLEDPRDLSTDGTHAMFSYIAMAVNFSEMGKLANAMRLLQDHVNSDKFEVVQTSGGKIIIDMFKALGRNYGREYVKTGEGTRVVKAINEYIDRLMFNDTKEVMGAIPITTTKEIDKDALFNLFMKITSKGKMGFNILSGITNVTQGETQMVAEASAKRYFDPKSFAAAKAEYHKLLFDYIGNFNSADRHDKMYMLINQFNSSEDFFKDMKDKDFNKSAMKRVMGRGNIYFLNSMGEHYLHTAGMLSILKFEKVYRASDPEKKEISLYDAIKQVHDDNGWHLELDSDIVFIDKNRAFLQNAKLNKKSVISAKEDRDALFESLAVYINHINAGMHGGYSEAERGNNNRQALWRAILQFRQWMFGMYNKMYSRPYTDTIMNTNAEGGYYRIYKFCMGVMHDWKNMSLKLAFENNHLTKEQKQNIKVAMAQSLMFVLVTSLCMLTKGWRDKDDRNLRLLAYQMKRLELELGAIVPNPTTFIKNIFTLIQSPAAGIKTLENLSQMFDLTYLAFWSKDSYIQSGRFKGWWRPFRAAWTASPIYNIQRLVDMDDYNYMFNIFEN